MATNVIFTRGNTATINATAITDGQILYNTTAGTQYLDNGTTRIQVGQNITVDTTLNSLSNNPIANRGVAGVMMSSLSEISTVTQAGSLPDALAVKALNSNLTAINSNLTANSTQFYYDYQNSQYGYNTAANRGADTFHPFKSTPTLYTSGSGVTSITVVSGKSYLINVAILSGYNVLSVSLSGCTTNYSSPITYSGTSLNRVSYLVSKIVNATSTNIGISFTTSGGIAGNDYSTLVAVNCFEI